MKYKNPVIPGFYPDPSICRVGEDYYLANSSFEFFPGVPLWHSRDLAGWEQIGHALTRESQLPLEGCRVSGGIYAPTLRYHQGRFYLPTTNVTQGGNFILWAEDIRGPWSQPVPVKQGGIDPSLFWDEDGTVYFQSTHTDEGGCQCIGQCVLNLETGEMLTETRPIWHGTGGKCPEGPHMFKHGGCYYLMIAEGGTEYGHMETIARGESPWGPFESCPHNPILTHRDINPDAGEFQALGHADLTTDPQGNWWMVFHAIRPSQFMLHHLGRETMLAPVTWENGWPVVNGGRPIAREMEGPGQWKETLPGGFARQNSFAHKLDFRRLTYWPESFAWLRNPRMENYRLEEGLTLVAGEDTLDSQGTPTFVGRRQQHFDLVSETVLDFAPDDESGEAGLTVFHTKDHHYDLSVTLRDGKRVAVLSRRVADMEAESQPAALPQTGKLRLRVEADRLGYRFLAGGAEDEGLSLVGTGSTQLLSTECMICTFTGCFVGLFCQGRPGIQARFDSFSYLPEGGPEAGG